MERIAALTSADAKKLTRKLRNAKTSDEAKAIIEEFSFDNQLETDLQEWVGKTFKLGHDSTGFHFEIAFNQLSETVQQWVETRAFDAKKLADERVRTKLDGYLQSYIKDGKTYDDFREDIDQIYTDTGLGDYKPYHIETILRTEAQTASNYGRWTSNMDAIDVAPLWQFVFVDDGNHVEGTICYHVAEELGELIKPATWEGWKKYHAPNHFNCRSFVIAIPQSVIDRKKIKATDGRQLRSLPEPNEGFETTAWPWKKAA